MRTSNSAVLVVASLSLLSCAAPAQWKITEVWLGTDFVEITNVSPTPQPIAGVGIMTADSSLCPSYTPAGPGVLQSNGPYVSSSPVIVPPGGTYVFEDNGFAGGTGLTAPTVGPGEHTGFNFSWGASSWGEVAIYVGASIVGGTIVGTPVDYMHWQAYTEYTTLAGVLADGFRYNPPLPAGLWLSGPIIKGTMYSDMFRVTVGGAYSDTNSNADWNVATSHTGGMPNPPGVLLVPTSGVDLEVYQPAAGTLAITVTTGNPTVPFGDCFNLISLAPTTCAGSGPVFGLAGDVFPQLYYPAGMAPFHVTLGPAGSFGFFIAGGIPPGIYAEVRSVVVAPGFVVTLSDFVYITTI